MRELVTIPLIHSPESVSMGIILGIEPQVVGQAIEYLAGFPNFWDILNREIAKFKLERPVRIYYDSYCEDSVEISDISTNLPDFSPIGGLLKKVKTVIIETTENKELVEAYLVEILGVASLVSSVESIMEHKQGDIPDNLWQSFISDVKRHIEQKDQIFVLRDRFVAQKVADTLLPDETGFLFMGAYHNVIPFLSTDIKVRPLSKRLITLVDRFLKPIKEAEQMFSRDLDSL